jgi:hypothetical protein
MKTEAEKQNDSIWWNFIEALSDEFINQTGFGIYAHITPLDVHHVYKEYQQHQEAPIRHFARDYVRSYV